MNFENGQILRNPTVPPLKETSDRATYLHVHNI